MRNIEIAKRENRLDSLFERIGHAAQDAELQSHWTRYLCILVSGFLESSIRTTFASFANKRAQSNVASFVTAQLGFLQNPKMGKILELVRKFSAEWAEQLEADTQGEIKAAVNSIVANRNKIAHGEDVSLGLVGLKDYYKSSKKLVKLIEQLCDASGKS
ncbi:MAG: hypothetical protein IH987_01965 [Planctomycetes bacterium]|nr:hypothetical protein [Planctomycetota bacterium]